MNQLDTRGVTRPRATLLLGSKIDLAPDVAPDDSTTEIDVRHNVEHAQTLTLLAPHSSNEQSRLEPFVLSSLS